MSTTGVRQSGAYHEHVASTASFCGSGRGVPSQPASGRGCPRPHLAVGVTPG